MLNRFHHVSARLALSLLHWNKTTSTGIAANFHWFAPFAEEHFISGCNTGNSFTCSAFFTSCLKCARAPQAISLYFLSQFDLAGKATPHLYPPLVRGEETSLYWQASHSGLSMLHSFGAGSSAAISGAGAAALDETAFNAPSLTVDFSVLVAPSERR